MDLKIEPKAVFDAYSTPIVQQTSFWPEVKERLGMHSCAFEYSVRNSDLYDGVGGFSRTNADFIMFYQYLNDEDYVAYVPLAAMFLVMSAYRATYLYGASSSRMRSVMPTYALQ